jgi:putative aldouronate transport system substrate-binding protein
MRKAIVSLLLSVLIVGGAARVSAADKPTLRFLITSSFYDLKADAGWEVSQRVSGYNIDFQTLSGTEQLMLIISSGEAYDYIYLSSANYNRMINESALLDISDLLAKNGKNITKAITTLWPATTVNGKIYAIPSTVAQPDSLSESVIARQDLLEPAGIKMATTTDELYAMLTAIRKAYPDKIPLTLDSTRGYFLPNLAAGFGFASYWQDMGGSVVPMIKLPKLKAYIEFMAKLYREKLIDAEMPALSTNDKNAKFTSNKAVMMKANWNGIETVIGALRKLEPNMRMSVMPILSGAGGTRMVEKRTGVGAYGGIPVTSKHPADAIKAIDNMIDLKSFTEIALGIEGRHYNLKDGKYSLIQPAFNNERVNSNVFIAGFYREDVYPKMWEARLSKNADLEWVFQTFKASLNGIGVADPTSLAPTVTVVDNKSALDTYVKDALTSIVAGAKPLDEIDRTIAYWDAKGGLLIEKFYNDWYRKK